MQDHPVIARARRALASHLGMAADELPARLRLREDLGLDALGRLDLLRTAEAATGLVLAEDEIDAAGTVGDVFTLLLARARAGTSTETSAPPAWLRVTPADSDLVVDRHLRLTPYMLQMIGQEAVRAGRGGRVEAVLPPGTPPDAVARVARALAGAQRAGATVVVRCGTALLPPTRERGAQASEATRRVAGPSRSRSAH